MSELKVMEQAGMENERSIEVIEEEIWFYKRQAGRAFIEIGRRLNEAKERLPHGEWLPWLKERAAFSERTAQDFMKLAKEYGESAEIADLGAAKALALMALPASERAEFAAEKHVVNGEEKTAQEMTVKELKEAIREREEARAELNAAEAARDKMAEEMKFLNERLEGLTEEVSLRDRELKALRERPVEVAVKEVVDQEAVDRARTEGEEAARKESAEELRKAKEALDAAKEKEKKAREQLKELKEAAGKAEEAARQAREDAEKARREKEMAANKDLAAFGVLFEQTQQNVNRMADTLRRMDGDGRGETADRLRMALDALAKAVDAAAKSGGGDK